MTVPAIRTQEDIAADPVVAFMRAHMQRKGGAQTAWDIAYEWYSDWWADASDGGEALTAKEFGGLLASICQRSNIRVKKRGKRIYCMNVQLIAPDLKALPAPGAA